MTPEISKWGSTQAVREIACPWCSAKAGSYCVRPGGHPADTTHGERIGAYLDKIGREEWDKRHTGSMASSATLQKGRIDLIIKGQGKVGAVGKGNTDSGLTRWRQ